MTDQTEITALLVNTSLKRDPAKSHTRLLLSASANILRKADMVVDQVHLLDHQIPPGVYPDMREHGWKKDDWPELWKRFLAADILIIGTPLWLGEESSVCRTLIERLYAMSDQLNDQGQSIFYGKVSGCVVTGNEDGIKHVAMTLGFSMNHLGFTIPPQADCGWIGEAGPGPSYADEGSGGPDNDFTQRNTTFMTWNLMHLARMLKSAGGIPAHGNQRSEWEAGCRFDHPNPDYR
jgi:multimeric flavodoxin WrbA